MEEDKALQAEGVPCVQAWRHGLFWGLDVVWYS